MREARCRHAGRAAARRAGRRGVRWRQAGPHGAPLTRRAAGPDAAHAAINVSRWLAAQREQCTRRQDQRGRGGAEERRCREQHWRPASQLPSPISRWPSTLSAADATARARPARHSRCSRPPPDALASTVAPSAGAAGGGLGGAALAPTANAAARRALHRRCHTARAHTPRLFRRRLPRHSPLVASDPPRAFEPREFEGVASRGPSRGPANASNIPSELRLKLLRSRLGSRFHRIDSFHLISSSSLIRLESAESDR